MKNIKILIVEDEKRIRDMVVKYLAREGFTCLEASNGEEGIERFETDVVDLVIMDVMMPVMDGWSCLREIRQRSETVPVIMLTARSEENDKLFGFELGVDDYLTKPFSVKELMVRIKALLKRSGVQSVKDQLTYGNTVVDTKAHRVLIEGKVLELTATEYDLILYFANNMNIALSRETIIDRIWGYDYFGDFRTVDTHIKRLRKKIDGGDFRIETVRGVGYQARCCDE
ncbi:MAG: response regulator transcription factor [Clostridia bacterium]|nr:response regulator transcription factor [Clostridia bacterium]